MTENPLEFWLAWFHEPTDGDEIKKIAQTAEQLGFTGIALADHVAIPKAQSSLHPLMGVPYDPLTPCIDPFTVAATMGAVTKSLRFMTYALVAGMRDPFSIAKQSASLSNLTNGRFDLGITPGWFTDEMALLGHDPRTRGERFDEALEVIHGLWNSDLFQYDGEHYNFKEVGCMPRPRVVPKIYIGGHSPKAFRRARKVDGWIGMPMNLDEVVSVGKIVRQDDPTKKIFLNPVDAMTEEYRDNLLESGVNAVVSMIWMPGDPAVNTTDKKCDLLSEFSRKWISCNSPALT